MKKVQVLLSTYNGEKYLKEQIESILKQKEVDIHLLVRDDGSSDSTIKILEEISNKNKKITDSQCHFATQNTIPKTNNAPMIFIMIIPSSSIFSLYL